MTKAEFTTRQAAEQLNESDRLVRLWCQQGRFPNAHLMKHPRGDYWVIPVGDLVSFVKPKPGPVPKSASTERKRATGQRHASNGTSKRKKGSKK